VERNLAVQVVPLAMEEGMLLHVDDNIQVARRSATGAGLALSAQAQALSSSDAGRDLHSQLALILDVARPTAGRARRADDRSRPAALPARPRDGEKPLLISQLAAPMTLRAGRRLGARRRAGALARLARLVARNLNRRFDAPCRFVERDLEVVA